MIFRETALQGRGFLLLLCAGLAAGVLYDGLTLLRRWIPPGPGTAADILWGVLVSAMGTLALAAAGEQKARLYALLGLALGGAIYAAGIHRALAGAARFLKKRIKTGQDDP